MTETKTKTMFYIGDSTIKSEESDISLLPIEHLPMSYFPFYYNTNETSIEKMRRLVPLLENYIKTDDESAINAKYTIDTDELFTLLSELEDPAQPFNNNNVSHIAYVIIFVWICIALFVLQIIQYYTGTNYVVIILIGILLLLILGVGFALFMANSVIT